MHEPAPPLRPDLVVVAGMVTPGARLLDIGCGRGALLARLGAEKGVDGRGIELKQSRVAACVARGLSVIQGDADTDLADYPDGAFDFVILSQTLPAVRRPLEVLRQMLRIGSFAIVSIPNAAAWRYRLRFLAAGRVPVPRAGDETWYTSANIHPCSIADFLALCRDNAVAVVEGLALMPGGARPIGRWSNLLAEQAVFLLKRA
jgi:methionine biosynthesis protein MetW